MSVSLAALLVAGCGENRGGEAGGAVEAASIDKGRVTPEDLKAAVSDERVKAFYAKRGWQPVWTEELAQSLEPAFAEAERHAINPAAYRKLASDGATPAEREAGLTRAVLDYAGALAGGIVDPAKIYEVYEVPRPKVDHLAAGFAGAVESGGVPAWLAGLAPSDPEYRALSDAYLSYRRSAASAKPVTPIEFGGKIEKGDRDPRVPLIVEALRANGYYQPAPPPAADAKQKQPPKAAARPSDLYTAELASAVSKLQQDYGIKPDGIIGDDTIEALSIGPADRARILAVNLERRRWLERTPPQTRIDVNTAAAFLTYWRDGAQAHQARVVVGQPDWETPELGSPITRLVANPPWTVPESIAEEEILPKGAAYMAKENIVMKNGRLVQEPGPKSALGLVKFDMANKHQIYLHDTPAKALFASNERHASHGCSRVEDAVGFARMLAADQGLTEDFEEGLASGKETGIDLKQKIPVRLLYHSAYWDGSRILFRTDPYGWDDKLAEALGLGKQVRRRIRQKVDDIGP
ncbi:MAG TPA: L,D-transpeptidase family protein [Allosphingosinicella sp.]